MIGPLVRLSLRLPTKQAWSAAPMRLEMVLLKKHAKALSTSPMYRVRAEHAVAREAETYDHGSSANYGTVWKWERYLAIGMLPLIPIGVFVCPGNFAIDSALAVAMVLHGYGGLSGMCTDYLSWRGHNVYKGAKLFLAVLSAVGLGGLMMFNYNDVGITNGLRLFWTL